ncbi:MAG: plastocyanin/azurin family copper-binding protein [Solirubrobacterales bacterium]
MNRAPLRALRLPVLLLGVLVLSGESAAVAQAPKPTRVTVSDYFFSPSAVTIRKGSSVKWVWSSANTYPHDVHLKSGPKGLREKRSYSTTTSAVAEARFQKAFETPGTYRYFCTIHPTKMRMTVVVSR